MTGYLCPKGHESSEPDFCSVCGCKMQASVAVIAPPLCPDCGTAHELASGVFCEMCGYNFNTNAHGVPKAAAPQPAVAEPAVPESAVPGFVPAPPEPVPHPWGVLIEIDPSLKSAESPDPPANFEPIAVLLPKDSNLIGRSSEKRGVFPEISLDFDEAVSHRHALLNRLPDGSLILRDIGSSNGTTLNGADLRPLTDTPVKEGDRLTLGHWTRITIQ